MDDLSVKSMDFDEEIKEQVQPQSPVINFYQEERNSDLQSSGSIPQLQEESLEKKKKSSATASIRDSDSGSIDNSNVFLAHSKDSKEGARTRPRTAKRRNKLNEQHSDKVSSTDQEYSDGEEVKSPSKLNADFQDQKNELEDSTTKKEEPKVVNRVREEPEEGPEAPEREVEQRLFFKVVSEISTIVSYLISDIKKKPRSFNIGIFTVFLVVSFLTLLQSVVDITPVAFLKLAEDAVGAVDFQLTAISGTPFENGNFYYYQQNPFDGSGTVSSDSLFADLAALNPLTSESDSTSFLDMNLLQFNELEEVLGNMTEFEGFAPRWLLPMRLQNQAKPELNTSVVLLIIDSQKEVEIGLGQFFSQRVLESEELMAFNQVIKYLQADPTKRDKVEIYFDLDLVEEFVDQFTGDGAEQLSELFTRYRKIVEQQHQELFDDEVIEPFETFTREDVYFLLGLFGFDVNPDTTLSLNFGDNLSLLEELLEGQALNITYEDLVEVVPQMDVLSQVAQEGGIDSVKVNYTIHPDLWELLENQTKMGNESLVIEGLSNETQSQRRRLQVDNNTDQTNDNATDNANDNTTSNATDNITDTTTNSTTNSTTNQTNQGNETQNTNVTQNNNTSPSTNQSQGANSSSNGSENTSGSIQNDTQTAVDSGANQTLDLSGLNLTNLFTINWIQVEGGGFNYTFDSNDEQFYQIIDSFNQSGNQLYQAIEDQILLQIVTQLDLTFETNNTYFNASSFNVTGFHENGTNGSFHFNATDQFDSQLKDLSQQVQNLSVLFSFDELNDGVQGSLTDLNLTFSLQDVLSEELSLDLSSITDLLVDQDFSSVDVQVDQLITYVLDNLILANIPSVWSFPYKVVEGYETTDGKFSNAVGSTAMIDCHYLIESLLPNLYNQFSAIVQTQNPYIGFLLDQFQTQITLIQMDVSLCNYAMQVNGVLKNQPEYYIHGEQHMDKSILDRGDDLVERLTLSSNATVSAPIKENMEDIEIMQVFLSNAMIAIVFFLGILCVQLVYSLMVSDIEEKTYNFGMIRALGLKKNSLIGIISFQAFSFSIPALLGGLLVAYLINVAVRIFLFVLSQNASSYTLSKTSIILGVLVGLFMPLFANVIPIQKALGKNLRSSLDLYHRAINELTVTVKRIQDMGLSVIQLIVGITLVVMGVLTYYVAPMAFLLENFTLFFFILNMVLIFMILGLSFVAMILQPYVQQLYLLLIVNLIRRDKKLYPLTKKNLQAHAHRNIKTAMMFTIALSFLIFAGSTFALIATLIESALIGVFSADLYVTAEFSPSYLDQGQLIQYLDGRKQDGTVIDYTFQPPELRSYLESLSPSYMSDFKVRISTSSSFKSVKASVYAVDSNFLDVALTEFYIPTEVEQGLTLNKTDRGQRDMVEALFIDDQIQSFNGNKDFYNISTGATLYYGNNVTDAVKILIPEGFREAMSLDTETPARFCLGYNSNGLSSHCEFNYLCKIRGMASKFPTLFFTRFRQAIFMGQVVMSKEQYIDVANQMIEGNSFMREKREELLGAYNFTDNIPINYMLVKVRAGLSTDKRNLLANEIRSYFSDDLTFLIDTEELRKSIESSVFLFQVFVGIVGTIALTLAFFLLLISTIQNIRDNVWEFGVLRAIGLNRGQSYRIYLYEALSVILGAVTLGLMVGLVVAATLTAQFFLFLEFSYKLEFPTLLCFVMILMAFVTTVLAVVFPVRDINKKQIAVVIKGSS